MPVVLGGGPSLAICVRKEGVSAPPHPAPPAPAPAVLDLHVVEGDADFLIEVRAKERDLGVALAEVVQHDEPCVHAHAHTDGLGGGAAETGRHKAGRNESRRPPLQTLPAPAPGLPAADTNPPRGGLPTAPKEAQALCCQTSSSEGL